MHDSDSTSASLFERLGPAKWLGLVWAIGPPIGGLTVLASIGPLSDWLGPDPQGGPIQAGLIIYLTLFILTAGLGLLPTYSQAILAGWVFGFGTGSIAALIGFTGAATLGYLIARLISPDHVMRVIDGHPKARVIREALVGRGFWPTLGVVALLRCPPNSPFALMNLAMATTGVARTPYILGTLIGMFPRTAVITFLAAAAAAGGTRDIQSFIREGSTVSLVGGLAVMFVVLGIIGMIANRALNRCCLPEEGEPAPVGGPTG